MSREERDPVERISLALAEAHRWDRAFERPIEGMLDENRGYDEDSIRAVAREFMVSRTLRLGKADKEKRENFKKIAAAINGLPDMPSGGLADHYRQIVLMVSEGGAREIWEKANFNSALSKFYMLKTKRRWPPFDRHAATTLGVRNGKRDCSRAIMFYERLDDLNFREACEGIRPAIDEAVQVPPERLIDKLLLLKGMSGAEKMAGYYLGSLPNDEQAAVWRSAERIAEVLPKHWMP